MSKLREATPITRFAPTLGINRKDALANMGQAYSPWILNADCWPQSIKLRNGYVIHSTISSSPTIILALGIFGTKSLPASNYLFAYCQDASGVNKIYDVSVAAESLAHSCADDTADEAFPVNFGKRLAFVTEADFADCNRQFDGSTWAAWGFTDGGSPIGGRVVVSYKSRVYIFSGTSLYYGSLEAITGDTTPVDFQYVIEDYCTTVWATIMTSPGQRADEIYLAFGTSSGETLVYGGDYPDSSTWQIVGRFKTAAPVGYNAIVRFRNDTWVLTDTGFVSLRDLFTNGAISDEEQSASMNIDPYLTDLFKQLNQGFWTIPISGVYWPEKNQILILVPGHIDKDGTFSSSTATMCVYSTLTQGWSFHKLSNVSTSRLGGLTYYKGNIYFFTENVVMKVDLTGYKDETYNSAGNYSSYSFEIQGAYSSFGDENSNKRVVGVQPIMKTDFDGTHVGVQVVADFGRQASDVAEVELVDGYNMPYYSVGAQGVYLQYRLIGESDTASTDGLELFATSMILAPGGTR